MHLETRTVQGHGDISKMPSTEPERGTCMCSRNAEAPDGSGRGHHPVVALSTGRATWLCKEGFGGTSLADQWLRLCAPNVGGTGSSPGQGTKIPHITPLGQKKKSFGDSLFSSPATGAVTHPWTIIPCDGSFYVST